MSLMQMKHRAPAWWAGCSNRYSHTKVLPASSPGALGSGNIHATLCTRASPGFTAQQGVLPSPKSLHYHLKFSPPVVSISCTETKSFSDLFSILSLLIYHLQFPLHPWAKAHTQILPSSPFYFPFSFLDLFCVFFQFPSCPAPNPALPSVQGGWYLAVLARGHPAALGSGGACPVLVFRSMSCLPGTQLFSWQKPR